MKKMSERERVVFRFIIVLFICGLLGGVGGFFLTVQEHAVLSTASELQKKIAAMAPWVMIIVGVFGMTFGLRIYGKAKQKFTQWDQEDEDFIEAVEHQIEKGIMVTEVVQILCFLLFGFVIWSLREEKQIVLGMISIVIFLILMIAMIFLQRAYIELIRKINPEKRGDALDIHFQKKWLESCDELEKMQMYEASYYSFQMMQKSFPIAMGILMFTELYSDAAVLPVVVLGILWLIQTVTYRNHAIKLSRKKGVKK